MLYVDIDDICRAFEAYVKKILDKKIQKNGNSLAHIVNVYYPNAITILELAETVRESILEYTNGKVRPKIEIIDNAISPLFTKEDKNQIKVDLSKARGFLGLKILTSPKESIRKIVKLRVSEKKARAFPTFLSP